MLFVLTCKARFNMHLFRTLKKVTKDSLFHILIIQYHRLDKLNTIVINETEIDTLGSLIRRITSELKQHAHMQYERDIHKIKAQFELPRRLESL